MRLPPFLLDQWMSKHDFADPPIAYNLASSTGPRWTVEEVARLGGGAIDLASVVLGYAPPEGGRDLREAIADFQGADPDHVVVTTGASEAMSILFCLLARPGGNVVVPDPGYPAYAPMAGAWGLGMRPYSLSPSDGFAQPARLPLSAVDHDTVAVLVNTPHNPSGSVMEPHGIAALAGDLAERGVPLIVDEVYRPLYFGPPRPSAAGQANVIVMSDMSKALSLPGLRLGWIIDADPERRHQIIEARCYFTISGSPLLERLAANALRHRGAVLARLHDVASANVARLDAFIAGSGGALSWVKPQGGTTAFPWFTDGRDSRPFCEALAAAGVLVAPGGCFGHPAHMRLGFAQQAQGFDIALGRMAEVLGSMLETPRS